jgi:hypothetical protein
VWLLIIQICATSVAVLCAVVASRPGSASLRILKRQREQEVMMSDLQSGFEALLESHKRLRSRAGMRELRAREEAPPVEDKKAIRRRLFGALAGPAFAARQATLDADSKIRSA